MTFWDWFKKEKFVLPEEETQVVFVEEIREKLKTAKVQKRPN